MAERQGASSKEFVEGQRVSVPTLGKKGVVMSEKGETVFILAAGEKSPREYQRRLVVAEATPRSSWF